MSSEVLQEVLEDTADLVACLDEDDDLQVVAKKVVTQLVKSALVDDGGPGDDPWDSFGRVLTAQNVGELIRWIFSQLMVKQMVSWGLGEWLVWWVVI